MNTEIVDFLLGPARLLNEGLIGMFLGIGMLALEAWLTYEIVNIVPPRAKNLIDAIDMELSQVQYFSGLKYRVYSAIFQIFLPLVMICVVFLSFTLFTGVVSDLFQ